MERSRIMGGTLRGHGADPHLLPHRRDRPLRRLLRGARLRGATADADPRRGDQRVHGPPRRRRPPRAHLQPRRRPLRARDGLQPHRADRRRPRRHARAARRPRDRAREAALPRAGGRLADLLRARPRRLPDRADRTRRRVMPPALAVSPPPRWAFVGQRPQHLIPRLGPPGRTCFVEECRAVPACRTPTLRVERLESVTRVWLELPPETPGLTEGPP